MFDLVVLFVHVRLWCVYWWIEFIVATCGDWCAFVQVERFGEDEIFVFVCDARIFVLLDEVVFVEDEVVDMGNVF